MKTAKELKSKALKNVESLLSQVNAAHDKVMKQRNSSNVVDKINEEEELYQLQSILYTYRSRLIGKN